jgi:16S rRNA (adenine1518-N6/adenine1519-N6)-dimethyltransferase
LTDSLAAAQAKHFILIELDSGYSKYWATRLGVEPLQTSSPSLEAIQILHADALHVPWRDFEKLVGPRVLVSNLPYSIAASLVVDLAESPVFDRMVLMFQKEVAERLMSEPGDPDYGMLSVVAQAAFQMTKLIDAGPQDFFPVPNVGSRVVVFERKPLEQLDFDRKKLLRIVKAAFAQRRKKIASNLAGYIPKAEMVVWLLAHGFTENARAEELSVAHYIELCSVKPLPPSVNGPASLG